jgi:hypothetical protein
LGSHAVAGREVSPAVPHYKAPCWFTLDPASLLVTSHYDRGQTPELVATEADT